jgi:hypothetical protein
MANEQDVAEPAVTMQERRAHELVNMASFVRGLTDETAAALEHVGTTINVYVGHEKNPVELMVLWAAEATEFDVTVTRFVRAEYANIALDFGVAAFHVYALKDQVCPRAGAYPDAPREWPAALSGLPFHRAHVASE